MKDPTWSICSDCKADGRFVWTSDGDIVCTRCGLVKEGHVISEEPEWRCFEDDDLVEKTRVDFYDEDRDKKASVMYKEHLHHFEDDVLMNMVDEMFNPLPFVKPCKTTRRLVILGVCVYLASKILGRSYEPCQICRMMNIPFTNDFYVQQNQVLDYLQAYHQDRYGKVWTAIRSNTMIKSIVHTLGAQCAIEEWRVIRVAEEMYNKVVVSFGHTGKTSTFSISVVYAACRALQIQNVCANDFVKVFNITKATLAKHEQYIQNALCVGDTHGA